MPKLSAQDRQHIAELLTPSWLSALVTITIGLLITAGVIVAFHVDNSSVQQQLIAWESTKPQPSLTTADQVLPQSDKPTLQGSWPLIVVWSLIGLVTYAVAMSVFNAISSAAALRQSLDYVNAKPRSLLITTTEHVILRIIALGILIGLLVLFIKRIVPYGITAAHASAADVLSLSGLLDALLAFAVIALSLHLQTIFLRLSLARPRVFS